MLQTAHPTSDRGNSKAFIIRLYFLTPLETTPMSVRNIHGSILASNFDTHKEHQTTSSCANVNMIHTISVKDITQTKNHWIGTPPTYHWFCLLLVTPMRIKVMKISPNGRM